MSTKRRNLVLAILFWILAFLSVMAIINQSKSFSFYKLIENLKNIPIIWLIAAILAMFLFIFFEGRGLSTICKYFKHPIKEKQAFTYASFDLYFSAITPSATGGQPLALYCMKKDKIPTLIGTIALMTNIIMYTLASLLIGIFFLILFPNLFANINVLSKILIVIGFLFHTLIILFFVLLLVKEKYLEKMITLGIRLLTKIHLIKEKDKKIEHLKERMKEYKQLVTTLKKNKKILLIMFLWNFLQKISQISVGVFIFLGITQTHQNILEIGAIQSFALIGAYAIPIPGGIGVTDYLLLNGFNLLISPTLAINLELLSRAFSFYFCILVCGFVSIIKWLKWKKEEKI